ncbi:E3 ubiquitin-protein ligase MARCHF3 [Leptinotarsa decemlineata]|uniref:E3 ubiquitin-protein ligase MARCHF3 n=1 Tax=Leptinotarsa decemlineata TaxID=7539 RepID=UPI000C255039|nr:E3 ubiquitin-protein ligase MARCH3-like [Leptinotarsa decemlineata]
MSNEITTDQSPDKLTVESTRDIQSYVSKASLFKQQRNVQSIPSIACRICHTNTVNEGLISPCNCKGTLAYVHLSCLERWLNQSSRSYCELCMYRYSSIETKRYKLCEGLRLWISHPRNRGHVRSDLLIGVLLTLVTSGLIASSVVGMEHFVSEGNKLGVQKKWIKTGVCLFLVAVVVGYMVTLYLIGKDHFLPWYRWWKNTVNIRLILPQRVSCKLFMRNDSTQI